MNASVLVRIALVMVVLASTLPAVEEGSLDADDTITLMLKYAGELSIRVVGSHVYSLLGDSLGDLNSTIGEIYLTIRYVLDVNVTIDTSLKLRDINITLDVENTEITSNHQFVEEFLRNSIASWSMNSSPGELHDIPVALRLKRGIIEFESPKRDGIVVAVTRYGGLDIVQVKNEYFVSSLISGVFIYGLNLYYEPLTEIPIHYVEVSTIKDDNGTFSSMLFVTLYKHDLNYSELFKDFINRHTFDVSINVTLSNGIRAYKAVLALVYVKGVDNIDVEVVVQNSTVWITINPPTTCFLVFGPLRDHIEQSSVKLEYYTARSMTGLQYVYYTPGAIECSELWIRLPAPVTEYKHETALPEQLPPPRPPPSADAVGYVITAITTTITLLITFLVCGYIAKRVAT